jgi:hypothetical protein
MMNVPSFPSSVRLPSLVHVAHGHRRRQLKQTTTYSCSSIHICLLCHTQENKIVNTHTQTYRIASKREEGSEKEEKKKKSHHEEKGEGDVYIQPSRRELSLPVFLFLIIALDSVRFNNSFLFKPCKRCLSLLIRCTGSGSMSSRRASYHSSRSSRLPALNVKSL